jgi:uncharacterized membrane protein YqaE (UPF0057 family)
MKNVKLFMLAGILCSFLINSCSVERRYHRTGLNVNWNNSSVKMKNNKKSINSESETNDETLAKEQAKKKIQEKAVVSYSDVEIQDVALNSDELILTDGTIQPKSELNIETNYNQQALGIASHNSKKTIDKSPKSHSNLKHRVGKRLEIKEQVYQKSSSRGDDTVLYVILSFFIPPLAVYLYEGSWTPRCTLNLILTLLCGLPGVIHALIVILGGK